MNLQKLFETQAKLDKHIVQEKGLEGQNLLDEKILALQVELGELANEWRGFKFWKVNPLPRNEDIECHACDGKGYFETHHNYNVLPSIKEPCNYCESTGIQEKNPLLMEYVDCLHFILSIGIDTEFRVEKLLVSPDGKQESITKMFNFIFEAIPQLHHSIKTRFFTAHSLTVAKVNYENFLSFFLALGEMLGFTEQQVEQAYLDKNKVNHERQLNGY